MKTIEISTFNLQSNSENVRYHTERNAIRLLSAEEIEMVDGGNFTEGAAAFGAGLAIGGASLGAGFGAVGVGLAVAAAPMTVVAMVGLAAYAGYSWGSSMYNSFS